jgi:membrane protein
VEDLSHGFRGGAGDWLRRLWPARARPAWARLAWARLARLHWVFRLPSLLKETFTRALANDCLNLGRSAAYSAMVALFPALIVSAAAVALVPAFNPVKRELGHFFGQVLPSGVSPLLTGYFDSSSLHVHTWRLVGVALLVSLSGATSVLSTVMEGLRRAAGRPQDAWGTLARTRRAVLLVFLSLLPLLAATIVVMFGELLTHWVTHHFAAGMRPYLVVLTLIMRWAIALAGVAGVTSLIYHLGTPPRPANDRAVRTGRGAAARGWARTIPGAIMATLLWFMVTLLFGFYVRHYATYNVVYGSLGAGIVLLFWLFLVFLSVLCGAEFNAQFFEEERELGDSGPRTHTPD